VSECGQADLLVVGGTIVSGRPSDAPVEDGALAIVAGRIVAIGSRASVEPRYSAARRIDATGSMVFPGLVDTHTHLYQTLLKGLGDDLPLMAWLDACTLPTIPHLTPRICYVAAALGCIESLRSGCTTIFDYMVDHPDTEVYDATIEAFDAVGIQGVLGRGLRNRLAETVPANLPTIDQQLADCVRLVERYGRERIWLAPGATWTVELEALQATRRLADAFGMRISLHTEEVPFDSQ